MEMKSNIASLTVFLVEVFIFINGAIAQVPSPEQQNFVCGRYYHRSNTFLQNLDTAFDTLAKSIGGPREYTGYSSSQSGKQVYAIGLCPPNANVEACRDCLKHTSWPLRQKCYKEKEGVGYSSLGQLNCMVRFSDQEIERKLADSWGFAKFWSTKNELKQHVDAGLDLLDSKLKEKAAGGDNRRKFASVSTVYGGPGWPTIYGSMQCTPDLTKEDCVKCLSTAVNSLRVCCASKGKVSGRTMLPSCVVRYSHENFI